MKMDSVNSSPKPLIRRTEPASSPTPSVQASSPRPLVFGTKAWSEEFSRRFNANQLDKAAREAEDNRLA